MTEGSAPVASPIPDPLDAVVPFRVDALDARGRAVLVGPMLDAILDRHDYPEPVARLLGEMIVLTVLLGTSLKFQGKFIVQSQTEGPVSLLVVEFATPDGVRAYARWDDDAVNAAVESGKADPEALLGKGVLALTVDQGTYMNRYQGIVALDGSSLEEVARSYFRQSEQIPTELRLAVGRLTLRGEDGRSRTHWRAGGILVQFLPDSPERARMADLHPGEAPEGTELHAVEDDDAWREVKALLDTVADDELVDEGVGVHTLLYRLFHERGVTASDPAPVVNRCTCSRERVTDMLGAMSAEERADSVEGGKITVKCEYCSSVYTFDPSEFDGTE
ncbi:Hsp33 family molecular chaperone [Oricola thermophila]|uniref:Hsp33 family molecular chaperone n=1 Tax=Oricola thermophila TaxID=2742145 RepID=A0A6N1VI21_9HYPH|nr:Hsp33 family molecular chaperone [Oricola thermophila]QKV19365.1 Hsp33 family molecular chaperone [Oricola thermophila]